MRQEVRYTGRVQGVGFRATARSCAQRFPVTGWVRNEPDGAVVLQVQGAQRDIDEFLVSLAGAMTRNIHAADANVVPDVDGEISFEIRRF